MYCTSLTNTLQFKYFQILLALFITIIIIVQSKTRYKLISDYAMRMKVRSQNFFILFLLSSFVLYRMTHARELRRVISWSLVIS